MCEIFLCNQILHPFCRAAADAYNESDTEELLKMSEADIVAKLQEIMGTYSTSNISITTSEEYVQFENIK
ncbi:MAG: hypothetical protein HDT38_01925 [Clostridiales bacterium]|nr:hypothetical protein [Clostridiales bacterium]